MLNQFAGYADAIRAARHPHGLDDRAAGSRPHTNYKYECVVASGLFPPRRKARPVALPRAIALSSAGPSVRFLPHRGRSRRRSASAARAILKNPEKPSPAFRPMRRRCRLDAAPPCLCLGSLLAAWTHSYFLLLYKAPNANPRREPCQLKVLSGGTFRARSCGSALKRMEAGRADPSPRSQVRPGRRHRLS